MKNLPPRRRDHDGPRSTITPRRAGARRRTGVDDDDDDAWMAAIQKATSCLRERHYDQDRLDTSLTYLKQLEGALMSRYPPSQDYDCWDRPPDADHRPVKWKNDENSTKNLEEKSSPNLTTMSNSKNSTTSSPFSAASRNSFASLASDSSDEEDEETGELFFTKNVAAARRGKGQSRPFDYSWTALGGRSSKQQHQQQQPAAASSLMNVRRLLIRIRTSQSEVYAAKAHAIRLTTQDWALGAQQYSAALQEIHAALLLADSQISKWMQQQQQHHASSSSSSTAATTGTASSPSSISHQAARHAATLQLQALQQDATIVEVAIASLTAARESYLAAAQQRQASLLKLLEPQWKNRDEARARWGEYKWTNNPNPSRSFAAQREQAERELKQLRRALELLQEQVDTTGAVQQTIQALQRQLSMNPRSINGSTSTKTAAAAAQKQQQRWNGLRPVDTSGRVSLQDYPDPVEFGWSFTGSNKQVEFFEQDGIWLDWYSTSGKIALYRPLVNGCKNKKFIKNGNTTTLLAATAVDPVAYRTFLERDPRFYEETKFGTNNNKNSSKQRRRRKQQAAPSPNQNNSYSTPTRKPFA